MKKLMAGMLIIIISISLIACAGDPGSKEKGPETEAAVIHIGVMPDVESIPFLIAEKNGYFTQEGVKVEIQHFSSAKDRDSALQSGRLDGVITDMAAVIFANEGGIDLRMIARTDGNISLMAGKDSAIKSVPELRGKDIGLSTNTIMEYSLDKMLEAYGLAPEAVNKIAIPPLPTRLEMLQGNKIHAAILPEPMAGLAISNGAVVLESTDNMENKAGVIAFTEKSIQNDPDEITAIFRAYDQAVQYLKTESAESYLDFIIAEQSFPPAIRDSLQLPDYSSAKQPSETIFADVVQWMQSKELVKGDYKYQDLTDMTILR